MSAEGVARIRTVGSTGSPLPVEGYQWIYDEVNKELQRIRKDLSDPSGKSISMFVAADQLLKGAAWNAVQIAEELAKLQTRAQAAE